MSQIKVSTLIIRILKDYGIDSVFIVSGGASIHLLHSLHEEAGIQPVPFHHEQGAAMAADGYSRAKGTFGVAIATSGPGATNLITGIAGAWFDSIPCLFITGQVATFRMKRDLATRQLGFQETDIVEIVQPIVKHAKQVLSNEEISHEIIEGIEIALSGRNGPVLLDIPDDIQRSWVTHENGPIRNETFFDYRKDRFWEEFYILKKLIEESKRPVLVLGAGSNTRKSRTLAQKLVSTLNIPTLLTWGAKDLLESNNENCVGTFGSHGTRQGNFVIQNSDLVIAIGTRLSTRETGGDFKNFARAARFVHIDIDAGESSKFEILGRKPSLVITGDSSEIIDALNSFLEEKEVSIEINDWRAWVKKRCDSFKYELTNEDVSINGYDFYLIAGDYFRNQEQIFLDTGCTVAWAMQCLRIKNHFRVFHDNNNTAMGWSLPAAIGGALANPGFGTTCIVGDGSLMMNVQELATAFRYAPSLRVICLNNSGYGMVRQTERQWLESKYVGTDSRVGDLVFPEFTVLANSFGMKAKQVRKKSELRIALQEMYEKETTQFLEVIIEPDSEVNPQARFGYPIEDSEPALSQADLESHMIIPILQRPDSKH